MTNDTQADARAMVEVTQADREAFIDLFEITPGNHAAVRAGEHDYRPQMQRLSRHRLAATQPKTSGYERAREDAARVADQRAADLAGSSGDFDEGREYEARNIATAVRALTAETSAAAVDAGEKRRDAANLRLALARALASRVPSEPEWGAVVDRLQHGKPEGIETVPIADVYRAMLEYAASPPAPTTAGEGLGPHATRIDGNMVPLDYLVGGMTYLRQGDSLIVLDEGMRASLAAALSPQAEQPATPTTDEGYARGIDRLVDRLENLKAISDQAVANSEGLADHKLLILANYGALALDMAPSFRAALTQSQGGQRD